MEARENTKANLERLREQLDSGSMRAAGRMIHGLRPPEVARLLESVPLRERASLWEMVDSDDDGDILVELAGAVSGALKYRGEMHDMGDATLSHEPSEAGIANIHPKALKTKVSPRPKVGPHDGHGARKLRPQQGPDISGRSRDEDAPLAHAALGDVLPRAAVPGAERRPRR